MINFNLTFCSLLTATLLLSACGEPLNSRYGDKYWDPMTTWETVGVTDQPSMKVEYRNIGTSADEEWQAYLSIDFTDLANIAVKSPSFNYYQGTSSTEVIDPFLQSGALFNDTQFSYDTETGTDKRLKLTYPGKYNFKLELQITQPNGTIRDYDYIYHNIVIPGPIKSSDYFSANVNATLGTYCLSCHKSGGSGSVVFELSTSENDRRADFLAKVNSPTEGKEILNYPFTTGVHLGASAANSMSSVEKAYFQEYISLLLAAKNDEGANITTDIELQTIAKPSTMLMDPWAP